MSRLPQIDGLRGLACMLVVLHHCYSFFGHVSWPSIPLPWGVFSLPKVLNLGYGGVEIFFVLSGFCLALPFFKPDYKFSLKRYFTARIKRIYPAYLFNLFSIIAYSFISHSLFSSVDKLQIFATPSLSDIISSILMLRVWGNTNYWTLIIEIRWYALLPFFALAIRKLSLKNKLHQFYVALIFLASIFLAISYSKIYESTSSGIIKTLTFYISPVLSYLPLLLSGVIIAWIYEHSTKTLSPSNKKLILSGTIITTISTALNIPEDPFTINFLQRVFILGPLSISVLLCTLYSERTKKLLTNKFLLLTGDASYSIYLVHAPLMFFLKRLIPFDKLPYSLAPIAIYIFVPILVVLIALPLYTYIEKPFIKKRS